MQQLFNKLTYRVDGHTPGSSIDLQWREPVMRCTGPHCVSPLMRSKGDEVGAHTEFIVGLQSSLALNQLDFESELLYVGDAGITQASRPSGGWEGVQQLLQTERLANDRCRPSLCASTVQRRRWGWPLYSGCSRRRCADWASSQQCRPLFWRLATALLCPSLWSRTTVSGPTALLRSTDGLATKSVQLCASN